MEMQVGRGGTKLDTNMSKQPKCQKTMKQCLQSLERKKYDLGTLHLARSRCLKHERTKEVKKPMNPSPPHKKISTNLDQEMNLKTTQEQKTPS